jgi:hypothetical protein
MSTRSSIVGTSVKIGQEIATWFTGEIVSAGDLSGTLGEIFSYAAKGQIKPKIASTLAYLGQTLLQSVKLAQHEYINACGADNWRCVILCGTKPPPALPKPAPKLAATPSPAITAASESPQASSPASAPGSSSDPNEAAALFIKVYSVQPPG